MVNSILIVTNIEAKGRKGAIVAMVKGTVAEDIIAVLKRVPERSRKRVQEVTMDMALTCNWLLNDVL
ncbi:hypothetical protein [Pedobacter sp.]|uniref:hypothetical protein n=1 Tax=Pedobacter sp. TaxID=1411316 RepID=UPI003D7F4919